MEPKKIFWVPRGGKETPLNIGENWTKKEGVREEKNEREGVSKRGGKRVLRLWGRKGDLMGSVQKKVTRQRLPRLRERLQKEAAR